MREFVVTFGLAGDKGVWLVLRPDGSRVCYASSSRRVGVTVRRWMRRNGVKHVRLYWEANGDTKDLIASSVSLEM